MYEVRESALPKLELYKKNNCCFNRVIYKGNLKLVIEKIRRYIQSICSKLKRVAAMLLGAALRHSFKSLMCNFKYIILLAVDFALQL